MKPTHPVELIVSAFATQEGWFVMDTRPRELNNPLDLDFEKQLNAVAHDGSDSPLARFSSPATGITGAFRQVWLWVAMGYSVTKMVETQAPPPNDMPTYLKNVLAWTGLPADTPVLDLLPPLVQLNLTT